MYRRTAFAAVLLGAVTVTWHAAAEPAVASEAHQLSLEDAVRTALARNADLYIAREDVRDAQDGIALARAPFAPRLVGEVHGAHEDQAPSATAFGATDTSTAGSLGIEGRAQTGLAYKVSAGFLREDRRDSYATIYDPATTTTVHAEITQPLWRGAFAAARQPIVVASLRRDRSEQELRAHIERTLGAVEAAYWNLVRARSERDARTSALAVAEDQLAESGKLQRLGTGSDLDVLEAQAGVSRRREELLVTEQDVVDADGQLFGALGVRAGDPGWAAGSAIAPTDAPQIEPLVPQVDVQLDLARARRADLIAAHDLITAEQAELGVTDDQRRSALDLVAAAGTTGFAGALATTDATAGINGTGLNPPYRPDPAYDGGLGTSLKNTLGRDVNLYIGLRFETLLGDHEAEVRHRIQRRTVSRAQLAERQLLARVESEVRTTVARVAVAGQLVEAADQTVAISDQLLEGMRKRFRAGASTTFDVLRVSEQLTRARIEAARARADYRVNLTRLAAANGTLLEGFGVTVESLGAAPR
jgi:outer membrane protein TolC